MKAKVRLKKLRFVVDVPIFHSSVLVFLGYSRNELIISLAQLKDNESFLKQLVSVGECAGLAMQRDTDGHCIIWIPTMIHTPAQMAYVEHERRHVADYILSYAGVKHSESDTSETHAYLQSFLAEKMWDAMTDFVGYSY